MHTCMYVFVPISHSLEDQLHGDPRRLKCINDNNDNDISYTAWGSFRKYSSVISYVCVSMCMYVCM